MIKRMKPSPELVAAAQRLIEADLNLSSREITPSARWPYEGYHAEIHCGAKLGVVWHLALDEVAVHLPSAPGFFWIGEYRLSWTERYGSAGEYMVQLFRPDGGSFGTFPRRVGPLELVEVRT